MRDDHLLAAKATVGAFMLGIPVPPPVRWLRLMVLYRCEVTFGWGSGWL